MTKTCPYCKIFETDNMGNFSKHTNTCWSNPTFKNTVDKKCKICLYEAKNSQDFENHKKIHYSVKDNTCSYCGFVKRTTEQKFYQYHINSCQKNPNLQKFTCKYCNIYSSYKKQALSQHESKCKIYYNSNNVNECSRWYCSLCNEYFAVRKLYRKHNKEKGHKPFDFATPQTAKIYICPFCKKEWETTKSGYGTHIRFCKNNPNREIPHSVTHTVESKEKISKGMKKAHADNRANRWKNPHLYTSYAESFFEKVIENEFEDKNFKREYPMGKYFLDFAWPDKMKAIEIDGEQHQRFQHQKDSDQKKDKLAKESGWEILRISFKDMFKDTKEHIKLAKEFVEK